MKTAIDYFSDMCNSPAGNSGLEIGDVLDVNEKVAYSLFRVVWEFAINTAATELDSLDIDSAIGQHLRKMAEFAERTSQRSDA